MNICKFKLDKVDNLYVSEYLSFTEFVQCGIYLGANIVNGMPWSFTFKGIPVSHENDSTYLLCSNNKIFRFTDKDILVIENKENIHIIPKHIFDTLYRVLK